jgi:hypothetical protein
MVEDSLRRANKDIRSLLAVFGIEFMRKRLQMETLNYLKHLQEAATKERRGANYQYPGTKEDRLYPPKYTHRHWKWCSVCADDPMTLTSSASQLPRLRVSRLDVIPLI